MLHPLGRAAATTPPTDSSPLTLAAELIRLVRSEQLDALGPPTAAVGEGTIGGHALRRLDVDPADPVTLTTLHALIRAESAPGPGSEGHARPRNGITFFADRVVGERWGRLREVPDAAVWFVPTLVGILPHTEGSARRRVIDSLGLLRDRAGAAVPALARLLVESEADDKTRHAAALALLRIGRFPQTVTAACDPPGRHEPAKSRSIAAWAVGLLGRVIHFRATQDRSLIQPDIAEFHQLASTVATSPSQARLDRAREYCRAFAEAGDLGRDAPGVSSVLLALARTKSGGAVTGIAWGALARVGVVDSQTLTGVTEALTQAHGAEDVGQVIAALGSVRGEHAPSALAKLIPLLEHDSPEIAGQAARAARHLLRDPLPTSLREKRLALRQRLVAAFERRAEQAQRDLCFELTELLVAAFSEDDAILMNIQSLIDKISIVYNYESITSIPSMPDPSKSIGSAEVQAAADRIEKKYEASRQAMHAEINELLVSLRGRVFDTLDECVSTIRAVRLLASRAGGELSYEGVPVSIRGMSSPRMKHPVTQLRTYDPDSQKYRFVYSKAPFPAVSVQVVSD